MDGTTIQPMMATESHALMGTGFDVDGVNVNNGTEVRRRVTPQAVAGVESVGPQVAALLKGLPRYQT